MVHLTCLLPGGEEASRAFCRQRIRLPDASAGEPGGKDELAIRIVFLGEFNFGFGLWKLPARGVTLSPDRLQEITAGHGVEDQLGLGRRVEGRTRLRR